MRFKRATLRYGETPAPITPYQKAAQVWDERIGSARVQAHNWRLMALGSVALSLVLAGVLFWLGRSGHAVPYVVEIDPRGGARAVGPASEVYKPNDAQIAFHLARFVENVRALSIDPVVVRQSWLKAYDFVTDRAAVTLNEYARENDPFAAKPSPSRSPAWCARRTARFRCAGWSACSRAAPSRIPGG